MTRTCDKYVSELVKEEWAKWEAHHVPKQQPSSPPARKTQGTCEGWWWVLVDDFRTLPLGQIVPGIPHIGELSLHGV